jgi:acid phosphatase
MAVRREFMPILIDHGVQLVIAGHEHHYERFVPIDGTTVVVTGGGGRGTRRVEPGPTTAFGLQVAHFVYLVISGEELRLWAIDATGQTFDTARLLRGPPRRR